MIKNKNQNKKSTPQTDPSSVHYDEIVRHKSNEKTPYGEKEPSTNTEYK